MAIGRIIGIGIVMIIPSFVGAGAMWELFKNRGFVIAWIAVITVAYGAIVYKGRDLKD